MKGFGIEIKNDLLDPKHVKNMGPAVWLYMFLIDKMTSVDELGLGVVLGRKPIIYEEVEKELGISQDTYTRWISKLEAYPYIKAIRTPHGISFRVFKAHKRFKNPQVVHKDQSDSAKSRRDSAKPRNPLRISAESNIRPYRDLYKDKKISYKRIRVGDMEFYAPTGNP